jgi:hypothetical protein
MYLPKDHLAKHLYPNANTFVFLGGFGVTVNIIRPVF